MSYEIHNYFQHDITNEYQQLLCYLVIYYNNYNKWNSVVAKYVFKIRYFFLKFVKIREF